MEELRSLELSMTVGKAGKKGLTIRFFRSLVKYLRKSFSHMKEEKSGEKLLRLKGDKLTVSASLREQLTNVRISTKGNVDEALPTMITAAGQFAEFLNSSLRKNQKIVLNLSVTSDVPSKETDFSRLAHAAFLTSLSDSLGTKVEPLGLILKISREAPLGLAIITRIKDKVAINLNVHREYRCPVPSAFFTDEFVKAKETIFRMSQSVKVSLA